MHESKSIDGFSSCALYMHWPQFDRKQYTNSFIGYALKKQLSRYLDTNYLHLNGPIYFGREVLSHWPEDVLLDILGILKKRAKSLNQQVSLEINAKSIERYDYRRLYAAGINRYNIVADCSTDNVIERMEAGSPSLLAASDSEYMLSVELLDADQRTVSAIVQKARSLRVTHLTIWPRAGMYSELQAIPALGAFYAYERYHYAWGEHRSAYMEHMWDQKTVVGIGPDAESIIGNKRYKNASSVYAYMQDIEQSVKYDATVLDKQQLFNEYIMLNLGRASGIVWSRCADVMSRAQLSALRARVSGLKAKGAVWSTSIAFGISVVSDPMYQAVLEDLIDEII